MHTLNAPTRTLSVIVLLALLAPGAEATPRKGSTSRPGVDTTGSTPHLHDTSVITLRWSGPLSRVAPDARDRLTASVCARWPSMVDAGPACAPTADAATATPGDALALADLLLTDAVKTVETQVASNADPKVSLKRVVALYRAVLGANPTPAERAHATYGLATCHAFMVQSAEEPAFADTTDVHLAAKLYAEVVDASENPELVAYARLWLAQYLLGSDNDGRGQPLSAAAHQRYDEAAIQHLEALAAGQRFFFTPHARRLLVSTYVTLGRTDDAVRVMDVALTEAPDEGREGMRIVEMLPEVYSAMVRLKPGTDVIHAMRTHWEQRQSQPWAASAMYRLGVTYAGRGSAAEAIAAFQTFRDAFPNHANAPLATYNIALLGLGATYVLDADETTALNVPRHGSAPRRADASGALDALQAMIQPGSAWSTANAGNTAVVERMRQLSGAIHDQRYSLAYENAAMAHNAWVATPNATTEAARKAAASTFVATATEIFATAPHVATEHNRFEMARARVWAGDTAAALLDLDTIIDANSSSCLEDEDARTPSCAESALQLAWRTRREALVAQAGGDMATSPGFQLVGDASPRPTLTGTPSTRSTTTTAAGRSIVRYAMSPAHADYLRSTDALLAATISDPTIRAWRDDARSALELQSAQILYAHGQLTEARSRAQALIARAPASEPATAAANLVLLSLRDEGDDAAMAVAAADFATKVRGAGASDYAAVGLVAEFRTIEALDPMYGPDLSRAADDASTVTTAQRYLAFAAAHPGEQAAEVAAGRGIQLLARAGHAEAARSAARAYAAAHANAPAALLAQWYVATQSTRMLDVASARSAYQELLTTHARLAKVSKHDTTMAEYEAQGVSARHARWALAAIVEAEGDPRATAEAWQDYAREVAPRTVAEAAGAPTDEQAYWHAKEAWAKVGPREHARALKNYLGRDFAEPDPDHVVQAYLEQATLAEAAGDARAAKRARTSAREAYDAAVKGGKAFTLATHEAIATDDIAALDAAFNAPGPGRPWPADKKALVQSVVAVLDGGDVAPVLERASAVIAGGNPVGQLAAATTVGQAWLRHAAMLDIGTDADGTAFPVASLGEAFEPGTDGFDLWYRLFVDEDPDTFAALPALKRTPATVVGANEARERARDLLELAVDRAVSSHTWGPWTERAVALLADETRGTAELWHTPYCGAGPCATEAFPSPVAPANLPAIDGVPANAALKDHALAALRDGNLPRARFIAAQLRGDDADVHLLQAALYAAAAEVGDANAAFDRALARDGANLVALRGRTIGAFREHDDATALLVARKWVEAAPADADAHLHLGAALLTEAANARRHHDRAQADVLTTEAVATLERAITAKTSPDALREMAVARVQLASSPAAALKAKQAIDTFVEATATSSSPLGPEEAKRWASLAKRMQRVSERPESAATPEIVAALAVTPTPEPTMPTCGADVAKRRAGEVKRCVQAAVNANPALAGDLTLVWSITGGTVEDVRVTTNTTGSDDLGACAVAAVRTWIFPADTTCTSPPYTWNIVAK